jgi:hypothetical protein
MLAHSFSFLPIWLPSVSSWKLLSDFAIARYLRLADKTQRRKRLAATVEEAVGSGDLTLEEAATCRPLDDVTAVLKRSDRRVLLVFEESQPEHPAGILTPFDLL